MVNLLEHKMKLKTGIGLIIIALMALSCESFLNDSPPEFPDTLILTNGVIINGTGQAPICNKSIVIENSRIVDLVDDSMLDSFQGATILNVKQAFILPGFFNTHVHNQLNQYNLKAWARAGVTTVRDLGYAGASSTYFQTVNQLNQNNQNARTAAAGPLITTVGGYGMLHVSSADQARNHVNRLITEGANIIKIAIEDNLQGRTWPLLSDGLISTITHTAHERDVWVSAHVSRSKHVQTAIDCGVNELSHMIVNQLPNHMVTQLIEKDIYWNPTLELWQGCDELYNISWCQIAINNLRKFVQAGGKVALGTDFGGYVTHFDLGMPITEMNLMKEAGMSNMDIIVAATKNAAKVCGLESDLGTIASGKIADLLLVYRNPLDDLEALCDVKMVIRNGNIIVENQQLKSRVGKIKFCPPDPAPSDDGN